MIDLTQLEGRTPGPLHSDYIDGWDVVRTAKRATVAQCVKPDDAALFAAAPELLAEVQVLREALRRVKNVVQGGGSFGLTVSQRRVLLAALEGS